MTHADASPEQPEGITLLGSEMLTWSDLAGPVGPVRGDLVRLLLARRSGHRARALVAGPHDAALVLSIAESFEDTDVLVRSWLDAESLRAELPRSVQIYCGPLDRFAVDAAGYDVVVAVDGLDRLHSAEEERPGWRRTASELARLLRRGSQHEVSGELYLALRNEVGLESLLTLPPSYHDDDGSWPEGQLRDDGPVGVDALATHLAEEDGLRLEESWACFGPVARPSLAFPTRAARAWRGDPRLGMLVARASARTAADPVPVKNPGEVGRLLVRHGLAGELAPQWFVHFAPESGVESDAHDRVLVAEPVADDRPTAAYSIAVAGAAWLREVLTSTPAVRPPSGVSGDIRRLDGPMPRGMTLQDLLADAAAAHDEQSISELVRRYRTWLGPDPVSRERIALTLDNIAAPDPEELDAQTELAVVDGRLVATVDASAETVLLRTLVVAAEQLLARGARHPWPASYGAAQIAAAMAAAAGFEVGPELQDNAIALDRSLRSAPADSRRADATPHSWAELSNLVTVYQERLAEAEGQVDWLVRAIHVRQRTVRFTRGRLEAVQSSPEYWVGSRVLWMRALGRRLRAKWQVWRHGEQHEWREPRNQSEMLFPVEPDLLPPGYEAKSDEV